VDGGLVKAVATMI